MIIENGRRLLAADAETRFWSKVNKRGPVPDCRPDLGPCWLWTDSLNNGGYGRFAMGERIVGNAHRIAYEMLVAAIPEKLDLDHLCRVRCCVKPRHLEPVTRLENLARGNTIIRRNIEATHCPHGHPYSGRNLYIKPSGFRECRACHREQQRRYLERRRAKLGAAL
jgi:hypothetical protein